MVCIYPLLLIHSSVKGHLGCFYLLAVINNASMKMGMQISLGDPAFNFFLLCICSLKLDLHLFIEHLLRLWEWWQSGISV